ncbi:HIPL1-like protein [Mya arenaria]|uniref:HIPL1-like protein n=1 Tax=Mya arenaria TaxID=6604 RepID=A0ABY7EHH1_MYAAR|nr:HIPL1-like protein [Mya arenaria]
MHVFGGGIKKLGEKSTLRDFPGLCPGYCAEFFQQCGPLVNYYMTSINASRTLEGMLLAESVSLNTFGEYCYPDLLTSPAVWTPTKEDEITNGSCVCFESFLDINLAQAVFITHAGDGSGRLFVVETIGRVWVVYPNETRLANPFVNIERDVSIARNRTGDERGLQSITFHPNYKQNRRFYLCYTTFLSQQENTVGVLSSEFRVAELRVSSSDPDRAEPSYNRIILEFEKLGHNQNHSINILLYICYAFNGINLNLQNRSECMINLLFADDGFLYISVGESGLQDNQPGGDPLRSLTYAKCFYPTQHSYTPLRLSFQGKILRIDVDKEDPVRMTAYSIPPDNPFADGVAALPEIYAWGLRNPYALSMDTGDSLTGAGRGRLFCGDVGESKVEEVDLIVKAANYGWNLKEGSLDFCSDCPWGIPDVPLTAPIFEYNHTFPLLASLEATFIEAALVQTGRDYTYMATSFRHWEPRGKLHIIRDRNMKIQKNCSHQMFDVLRSKGAGRYRLFCGDIGESRVEKVDLIVNGANYGGGNPSTCASRDSTIGLRGPTSMPKKATYGNARPRSVYSVNSKSQLGINITYATLSVSQVQRKPFYTGTYVATNSVLTILLTLAWVLTTFINI